MGKISKDTFKKITLLYLIGKFKTLYSNYRLQKVLYFCEKGSPIKPFTFKHTQYGQFSVDAQKTVNALEKMGFIQASKLDTCKTGKQWSIQKNLKLKEYENIIKHASDKFKMNIDNCIKKYKYLNQAELKILAHNDEKFKNTKFKDVIISENLPSVIDVSLPYDDCEDLELSFNPKFISTISKLIKGIKNQEISINRFIEI